MADKAKPGPDAAAPTGPAPAEPPRQPETAQQRRERNRIAIDSKQGDLKREAAERRAKRERSQA